MRNETAYQAKLMDKLYARFPGCFIIKNDPKDRQGIPDLLILFGKSWAMLEVKRSAGERPRPNQPHYVKKFGEMAFASFIYPENEESVLNDLQLAFRARNKTRVSQS